MINTKIKVLIAEDDSLIAEDIKRTLEDSGYSVLSVVSTARDAIKYSETGKPDIILMDINLKGKMTGIDAAEIINKSNKIPIIFVTGLSDDETFLHAYTTKPQAYLTKPFRKADLLSKINKTFKEAG